MSAISVVSFLMMLVGVTNLGVLCLACGWKAPAGVVSLVMLACIASVFLLAYSV